MNIEKEITELRSRVEKLERALNPKSNAKIAATPIKDEFKGATGGVRLLISKGYFRTRRLFSDVTAELKSEGYLYSKQAFQEALNRLARHGGPLVTIKEGGNKVYAERK